MNKKLYYGKINLNSHIFEVYDKKNSLENIGNIIMLNFNEDLTYERDDLLFTDENGKNISYTAEYKVNYINKMIEDKCIVGTIIKKSDLLANDINEETGEIKKVAVPNKEIIKFFYDVDKEIVCFTRTGRFGFIEFCTAFENLLNKCMSFDEQKYVFSVPLLREGIDINGIKDSLANLRRIEELEIKITPPNPDSNLLGEIEDNSEEVIGSMKLGNITSKSILFTSKAPMGLNIQSKEIQDSITMAENLHSKLSVKESTKKSYIEIDAKDKSGRVFSTKNTKPVTNYINEKLTGDYEFATVCKQLVRNIFNSFF
ncbi:hypothetical protein [Clostridium paraputrificum]|uniref:hypothetical protein n=1 Tax=Clostridium paraputrificum TaxID=29363 RepID=UPI000DCFC0C3|nr:hypothetical protein [Clostridium paraputrificum]MDB2115669.1 hypothetical protein [Clostridium paraputrificum]